MSASPNPPAVWVAFWGAATAGLVVVIGLEHYFGAEGPSGAPRAPAKVADARLLPPFTLAAAEQVAPETVARPLFAPLRRPAPPQATVQPTMRRGQFQLTGVTVSPEVSFAFLKELATGKTKSIRKGAEINGLRLDVVEPRRVVLRQGEETEDLALAIQVPPKPVAAPSAPGTPAAPGGAPNLFAPGGVPLPGAPGGPPLQGAGAPGQPAAPAPSTPAATPVPGADSTAARRRPWMKP